MTEKTSKKGTVLVVDDAQANREIIGRILKRDGYDVVVAENGEQALWQVEDMTPDLVLLDIAMPGMDGFEVCRRLKADTRMAHVPVIFVTALSELGDKVRAFEVGAVDYIIKPFKSEEVLARVNSQALLARQRREIVALSDLKDHLMRTLSHDLKNPIQIIMGYAAMMMEPNDMTDAEMMEMSAQIFKSADKMFTLVTNLLDLTQIEEGIQWHFAPLSIADLAREVLEEFNFQAQSKGVALYLELPTDNLYIRADSMRIQQVLSNLVSNAVKYTPSGGGVQLAVTRDGDDAIISVIDNGLGIPAADIPFLFQRFYRVNTTQHREPDGTGLGLSIVKAIVDEHEGELTVESILGEGSAFHVRLPLAR